MSSDEHQAPAQQARDIEPLLARARLADRPRMTPADKLRAQTLAAIAQFERETRATATDPFEQVRNIADDYARHKESGDDALADLLDLLATEVLTLKDIRDIRLAAEAAAAITPRLIREEADRGTSAASIADTLSVSEGYVYRILRNRPQK
jgi:DNA invertase Pin-like site-specific DNA recombinase